MIILTGDTARIALDLLDETGAARNVAAALQIQVAIRRLHPATPLLAAGPYPCSAAVSGADWTNGLVVAELPSADLASLAGGHYDIEVRADLPTGPERWLFAEAVPIIASAF